ncbi:MAG: hypothetical protein LBL62_06275 [Planctomycetaceae bacterium]|jgi:hypothetical protein|nr:hypothetical protein [Planctomycetaceae bacterium]
MRRTKILAMFLCRKRCFFIGVFVCAYVCVFALPLNAQNPAGWDGYQSQEKNNELKELNKLKESNESGTALTNSEKGQFYLLRTGFLTEGTATNDGKQYLLKTNFGTMSIPVANVEFVGATREDVYHYKKGYVHDRDCNELIKLAEWCFNNKLTQQGIAEYQRALLAAPNPVLADVIRKRLETLQDPTSEPTGLSGVRTEFSQSSYSEEPDNTGISRLMNGIPKPIVNSFAKKVQPVLVSRCAATDCHGSSSENQFKLSIPSHTHGNTTYRNLRSVLQWIDLDYPTESQLLSVLVAYHGGTKAAFSVESAQYNNIVQWVRLAAKELPNEYRSPSANQKKNNNTTNSSEKEDAIPSKGDILPPTLRNAMIVDQPNLPLQNLPPTTNSVKDPFDPHIFNNQHHGKTVNRSEKQ